jgi:hypothetical protein
MNRIQDWWPLYSNGSSGIAPYEFNIHGEKPAYNYYLSYKVKGDPNLYKILNKNCEPIERYPNSGRKPWFSKDGSEPNPQNSSHSQYFITNSENREKNLTSSVNGQKLKKILLFTGKTI